MGSDLEAFSHFATDTSFATLVQQLTAITECLDKVFLSYWLDLPLHHRIISKVKLTCLTTVYILGWDERFARQSH